LAMVIRHHFANAKREKHMKSTTRLPMMKRLGKRLAGPLGSLLLHAGIVWAMLHLVSRTTTPPEETVGFNYHDPEDSAVPPIEPVVSVGESTDSEGTGGQTTPEGSMRPDEPGTIEIVCGDPEGVPEPVRPHLEPTSPARGFRPQVPVEWNQRVDESDPSVAKALDWLARHQNADGSWGARHQTGYTGLAVLTYLANGVLQGDSRHGNTVERGIEYLLAAQTPDGRFRAAAGHSYVYEHAIATYALGETAGLTRIPAAVRAAERGAQVILDNQMPGGAWGYDYDRTSTRADSSVTAWQVQALKACAIAGLRNPGLDAGLRRSLDGLRGLFREADGTFGYSSDNRRTNDGLTSLGVLCFQMNGDGNSAPARAGLKAVGGRAPDFAAAEGWPYYTGYYQAQALFHGGEASFTPFAKTALAALTRRQESAGSWLPLSSSEGGTDELTRRVYGTTFAALTLQVRTRTHLGTGKLVNPGATPAVAEDDIDLQFTL
jgi:Prenyltransferase and squalene oxidase repeat